MIKINSILDIVNKYENYIIDQWGVMHDGSNGYNYAIKSINYLKKNKNLFIISNSSKRKKLLRKNYLN